MAITRGARSNRQEDDEVKVTVLRGGARPQEVYVEKGASLLEAIEEAGFTVKRDDTVTVNGEEIDLSSADSADEREELLAEVEVEHLDRVVIATDMDGGR